MVPNGFTITIWYCYHEIPTIFTDSSRSPTRNQFESHEFPAKIGRGFLQSNRTSFLTRCRNSRVARKGKFVLHQFLDFLELTGLIVVIIDKFIDLIIANYTPCNWFVLLQVSNIEVSRFASFS